MATEQQLTGFLSFPAGTDLSANRFRFIVVNSSGELALAGAGALADGVLQDDPDAQGRAGAVLPLAGSVSKVEAGAAVTAGDEVMSDATGRGITATATNESLGKAITAAAAAGEFFEVLLNYRGTQ